MRNPICLFKTIWRSLMCGAWVSGHNYRTIPEKTPPNVHVLKCDRCGKVDVSWSWESLEHVK